MYNSFHQEGEGYRNTTLKFFSKTHLGQIWIYIIAPSLSLDLHPTPALWKHITFHQQGRFVSNDSRDREYFWISFMSNAKTIADPLPSGVGLEVSHGNTKLVRMPCYLPCEFQWRLELFGYLIRALLYDPLTITNSSM